MRRWMFVLIALALVAAACDSGGGDSDVLPDDETTTTEEGSAADSRIDDLYKDCEDGDDDACDDLYTESEAGSPEEAFGNNCGGRGLPPGEVWCGPERQAQDTDAAPEPTGAMPDNVDLEEIARSAFVDSCTESGGQSTPERCNCSFDYIVDVYGLEFFETVSPDLDSIVAEAVASCV